MIAFPQSIVITALAPLLFSRGAGAQCRYTVTHKIPTVSCGWSTPQALWPRDLIECTSLVAVRHKCPPNDDKWIPLRYTPDSGLYEIPTPPSVTSAQARGTNAAGMVVGAFAMEGSVGDACAWSPEGEFIVLPQLPDQWSSTAQAVNSGGMAVGYRIMTKGGVRPFVWDNGVLTEIEVPPEFGNVGHAERVSDSGFVAGYLGSDNCVKRAFRWSHAGGMEILPPLPGCIGSTALIAVNNNGAVLGQSTIQGAQPCQSGGTLATLWQQHEPEAIVPLEGYELAAAYDLNNKGVMVGRCRPRQPGTQPPVIWYDGIPCALLDLVIDDSADGVPPSMIIPYGINDEGQIMATAPMPVPGSSINQQGIWIFTPVDSPEGDLNGDCHVDGSDLAVLLGQWGPRKYSVADIDGSGVVDGDDLNVLLGDWTFTTPK